MGLLLFTNSLADRLVSYWEGALLLDANRHNDLANGAAAPTRSATGGKAKGKFTFADTQFVTRTNANCNGLNFGTRSFSVSLWVNPGALPGGSGQRIIGYGATGTSDNGFRIRTVNSTGTKVTANITDGTSAYSVTCTSVLSAWTHVVMVVNRANNLLEIWINGTREATTSIAGAGSTTGTSDLFLGASGSGIGIVGDISGVGIWGRRLTKQDILALYNRGNGLKGIV